MSATDILSFLSSLGTGILYVVGVVAGLWATIGRPVKKRWDADRKERLDKEEAEVLAKIQRESFVDARLTDVQSGVTQIVERLDKINGSVARIVAENKDKDEKLVVHGERLAFLEGMNIGLQDKEKPHQ